MKRPWIYGLGFGLFLLEPLLYWTQASPIVLGSVSMLSMVLLAGGLFAFVARGLLRLAVWTVFTFFVIIIKISIFLQAAHAFIQDDSLEPYLLNGIGASLALTLSAFLYGVAQKFRRAKSA